MHDIGGIFAVAGVAVVVCVGLYYRHLKAELVHKERMTAMEKGVQMPVLELAQPPRDPISRYLLAGMIWLFGGAGLSVFLFALTITLPHPKGLTPQERDAKIEALRNLGASNAELRRVLFERDNETHPIGAGTVGFIPMGVGLAYLIFYNVERKRQPPQP
jgi:hypothetical protein